MRLSLSIRLLWSVFLCIGMLQNIVAFDGRFNTSNADALAEVYEPGIIKERLSDVVGFESAKKTALRAIDTLKNPASHSLKSLLIKGRSGSGKTLVAKALAGEAGAYLFRIRISEEFLLNKNALEANFNIEQRLFALFAKAISVARATNKGVVLLIDNLHLALNDYVFAPIIKDLSGPSSYSFLRATLRNAFIKAIERIHEANEKIVLVACVTDFESWDKPYPREFEVALDTKLAEKFQETLMLLELTDEEVETLVRRTSAQQQMSLDKKFDMPGLLKKIRGLTAKNIINVVANACKSASSSNKKQLQLADFDLSGLREKVTVDSLQKTEFKGRELLGAGSKVYSAGQVSVRLDNVVVPEDVKNDLYLLADFIKQPQEFAAVGVQVPKGAVFFGDTGVGKTTLARAVAGQADAALIEISCGSFSGRLSEPFALAEKLGNAVVILFDEIDILAKDSMFTQNPLRRLAEEFDALNATTSNNVTVFATLKSLNIGVPELFKLNRFERIVEVGTPCFKTMCLLLNEFVEQRKIVLSDADLLTQVCRGAMGMSRSQLLDMVNRAAIMAKCANKQQLSLKDFEAARSAVMKDGEIFKSLKGDESAGSSMRGDDKFFQSPGKFHPPSSVLTSFKDVAGCEQAKEQLQEIVNFLSNPEKFKKCGAKVPCGVLMMGDPGTGKTLLARAVSGEAGCPFISVSASKFDDMYVGVGKNRVEALFKQARRYSPCLIFIDEIDAVGCRRDTDRSKSSDQTINQLLSEMDGFEKSDKAVVVIAATNRPDTLDPAVIRSGRFDRKVMVELPNLEAREQILLVHARKVNLAKDVDLALLAQTTIGFSGADLATVINEAALKMNREKRDLVTHLDLEWARDFVYMGAENRFLMKSERMLNETAYHEAGHALVRILDPEASPLHKVTIVPRGKALGLTWHMPEEQDPKSSKEHFVAEIRAAMGGRAAEELIFGKMFAGVSSDLEKATSLARSMVKRFGMSTLGPVFFADNLIANGISEITKQKIDENVQQILQQAYSETLDLLTNNRDKLHLLAQALLKQETLSEAQVRKILGNS